LTPSLADQERALLRAGDAALERMHAEPRGSIAWRVALEQVDGIDRQLKRLDYLKNGELAETEREFSLVTVACALRGRVRDAVLRRVLEAVDRELGPRDARLAWQWRERVRCGRRAA